MAAGLSVWQAVALSALLFSGGSQFALIGVLASGGSGVAAVAASSLLGLRNGFYGLQVARILEVRGWRRAVAAQILGGLLVQRVVGIRVEKQELQADEHRVEVQDRVPLLAQNV